jgi:hypothetical protein
LPAERGGLVSGLRFGRSWYFQGVSILIPDDARTVAESGPEQRDAASRADTQHVSVVVIP